MITGYFTLFSNLTLDCCSCHFHIVFLVSVAFSQSFLEFFYPDLQPLVFVPVPLNSLLHSLHTFCLSFPLVQNPFLFYIQRYCDLFLHFSTFQNHVCATCSSFSSENSSNLSSTFFSDFISLMYNFNALNIFSYMPIEILEEKDDFFLERNVFHSIHISRTFFFYSSLDPLAISL